eukprot:TRINITY_DN37620_c0_g1_i1.p1 TRINITY_DN37620_c0_g1~~TRINITY_DN37620_c0_g1_i1.p1  ORF type:complete len:166 (+),score=29.24 TRINITY_DN37620_c0_g1_i1:45-542(+)
MSFRRPPRDIDRMTSLRVGNLPYSAQSEDLMPLFEKFGDVGDVYFPLERGTGRSRGFAFVRYYDKRDAEDAIESLNGRQYDGRELRITMDQGRPQREGGFRGGRRSRSRSRGDRRRRSRSKSRSRSRGRRDRSGSRGRDRSGSNKRDRSGSRERNRSPSRSRSRS